MRPNATDNGPLASSRRRLSRKGPTAGEARRAAGLLAQGRDTDQDIATQLGISRRTLARWKLLAPVQAAFTEIMQAYVAQQGAEFLARAAAIDAALDAEVARQGRNRGRPW